MERAVASSNLVFTVIADKFRVGVFLLLIQAGRKMNSQLVLKSKIAVSWYS